MEGKEEKRARMEGIKGEVDMTFLLLQPQAGSHCLLDPWLSQCVSRPGCALRLSLGLVRIPGSTLTGAWLRIFTNIASPPPPPTDTTTPLGRISLGIIIGSKILTAFQLIIHRAIILSWENMESI